MRTLIVLLSVTFTYLLYEGLNAPRGEVGNIIDYINSHPLPNEKWAQVFVLSAPLALFICFFALVAWNLKLKAVGKVMYEDLSRFQAALSLLGSAQPNVQVSKVYVPGKTDPAEELSTLESELASTEQKAAAMDSSRQAAGGYFEKLTAFRARQIALRTRLETSQAEIKGVEDEIRKLTGLRDQLEANLKKIAGEGDNDLSEQLSSIEESLPAITEGMDDLHKQSGRLNSLKQSLEGLELKLTPLTNDTTGFDALYNEVSDGLEEIKKKLEKINEGVNNDTVEEDIDDMEKSKDDLIQLLEEVGEQFKRLITLKEELRKKVTLPVEGDSPKTAS